MHTHTHTHQRSGLQRGESQWEKKLRGMCDVSDEGRFGHAFKFENLQISWKTPKLMTPFQGNSGSHWINWLAAMFQRWGPTRFNCLHEPVTPWLSLPVDQLIEYPRWLVLCQIQRDAAEWLWQHISFLGEVLAVGFTCIYNIIEFIIIRWPEESKHNITPQNTVILNKTRHLKSPQISIKSHKTQHFRILWNCVI